MANLKPTSLQTQEFLKEAIIAPSLAPGVTVIYNGAEYIMYKMHENSLGWIAYSSRPDSRFQTYNIGSTNLVVIPFPAEGYKEPFYESKAFLPTKKSLAVVAEIKKALEQEKERDKMSRKARNASTASIPADATPKDIILYAAKGEIDYDSAVQFLTHFDPRWEASLAARMQKPHFRIEEILRKQANPLNLMTYAVHAAKKRLSPQIEEIIKLDPTCWETYNRMLPIKK